MFGTLGPIVAPADDDVAAGQRMTVVAEIPALKFKFDVHALPAFRADLALGFTVGESHLHRLDEVAQFFGEHTKEKYDALLVDRFMAKAAEVDWVTVGEAIL